MLTRWYDIERDLAVLDELHRRMNRAFDEGWSGRMTRGTTSLTGGWPQANLYDSGSALVALVSIPGLNEDQINVEVHGDVLTLSGERKVEPPEGYQVHRSERGSIKFSRSFGLPSRVDPEKTVAKLSNGLLTITMEKHPESQPKQIKVSAS